jgi:hypothetical protein
MEWVGVYLHDAHQRFRSNLTGDLDWTLSDTCELRYATYTLRTMLTFCRQLTSLVFIRDRRVGLLPLVWPIYL